jgi:hypothetical protein
MPTQTQARKAGIPETARLGMFRSAASRSASNRTMGQPAVIGRVARNRTTAAQLPAAHRGARRATGSAGRRRSR